MTPSRIALAIAALVLLPAAAPVATPSTSRQSPFVIAHVNVIDVRTGAVLEDRDVTVNGERIASIEPASRAPRAAGVALLDGHGKYLIPGLWDCHIHLCWTTGSALPLLVALGITDVRDLGGTLSQIEGWRARIADGSLVGPHILRVGPILNGKAFNQYQFVPGSVEATRGAVRLLAALGVDAIKVHRRMPRDWYFAALDEAKKQGLPLVGHIPMEVTPAEASNAGQYMIEHTETLFEGTFSAKLNPDQVPGAIHDWLATAEPDTLFATFVRNGTWLDPTLAGGLESVDIFDASAPVNPHAKYVAASQRKQWAESAKQNPVSAADLATFRARMNAFVDVTARMHQDGVKLVAGTDAAGPRIPGFLLHHELAALVRAGLTPLEALQTATLNPAIAFHRDGELGAVETGKLADLVLLDANPLERIDNTERIAAVIESGKLYRRPDLDRLLAEAERLAASN